MITLINNSSSKSEEKEQSLNKKVDIFVENNSAETELEKAVYEAERAVLKNMANFDNLRSITEEEIDRQIITDEIDPIIKTEDRLTTAAHLKILPEFIKYYLANKKIKQSLLKQIFRLLFSSFIAGGKYSLEIILPILEVIDGEEILIPEVLKRVSAEVEEKIIFWLQEELIIPGKNPINNLTTLKEIINDINLSNKKINDAEFISDDNRVTLMKIIKKCDLLTNEAKIRLIEKSRIFTNEEIDQLSGLLMAEIYFGQNNQNLILKELLSILKKFEEKLITR